MNIQPTSAEPMPPQMPPQAPPAGRTRAEVRRELHQSFAEQFQPEVYQQIETAWKDNPDMRMDVLEQAKQLSSDPNYPTPAQLAQLAQMIVGDTFSMPPTSEPPGPAPTPVDPPVADPPVAVTSPVIDPAA
jgi:hypothetical protein